MNEGLNSTCEFSMVPSIISAIFQDPLRQHVEDMAVHERMEWLKREGFTKRVRQPITGFLERSECCHEEIPALLSIIRVV